MTETPRLGPIALCTLVSADGHALAQAYEQHMHQAVAGSGRLDTSAAALAGSPALQGERYWIMANRSGHSWLQIVEHSAATPHDALARYGWLAMEVLVEDVDSLAAGLAGSPFEMLRPPADLDVSDSIRACQVRGPAGEILYLTQVRGEAPPFQLPRCAAPVDHLFIPVLSTPDRERSLAEYAAISGNEGLSFDTRITVVNQARGFELERRHPVATLQLAQNALLEIDQIAQTIAPPAGIHSGVACIAFHAAVDVPTGAQRLAAGPFAGRPFTAHTGAAGEHYALIYS